MSTRNATSCQISRVRDRAPESVSAYEKNQAASQSSSCGNEFMPTNIGCESTDSQAQGDENSLAFAVQQTFPEVANEELPVPPERDLWG